MKKTSKTRLFKILGVLLGTSTLAMPFVAAQCNNEIANPTPKPGQSNDNDTNNTQAFEEWRSKLNNAFKLKKEDIKSFTEALSRNKQAIYNPQTHTIDFVDNNQSILSISLKSELLPSNSNFTIISSTDDSNKILYDFDVDTKTVTFKYRAKNNLNNTVSVEIYTTPINLLDYITEDDIDIALKSLEEILLNTKAFQIEENKEKLLIQKVNQEKKLHYNSKTQSIYYKDNENDTLTDEQEETNKVLIVNPLYVDLFKDVKIVGTDSTAEKLTDNIGAVINENVLTIKFTIALQHKDKLILSNIEISNSFVLSESDNVVKPETKPEEPKQPQPVPQPDNDKNEVIHAGFEEYQKEDLNNVFEFVNEETKQELIQGLQSNEHAALRYDFKEQRIVFAPNGWVDWRKENKTYLTLNKKPSVTNIQYVNSDSPLQSNGKPNSIIKYEIKDNKLILTYKVVLYDAKNQIAQVSPKQWTTTFNLETKTSNEQEKPQPEKPVVNEEENKDETKETPKQLMAIDNFFDYQKSLEEDGLRIIKDKKEYFVKALKEGYTLRYDYVAQVILAIPQNEQPDWNNSKEKYGVLEFVNKPKDTKYQIANAIDSIGKKNSPKATIDYTLEGNIATLEYKAAQYNGRKQKPLIGEKVLKSTFDLTNLPEYAYPKEESKEEDTNNTLPTEENTNTENGLSVENKPSLLGGTLVYNNKDEYYKSLNGLAGQNLVSNLIKLQSDIIRDKMPNTIWKKAITRPNLAKIFSDTMFDDDKSIIDIYSENPTGADAYKYVLSSGVGSKGEAGGWNREHTIPKSWFGESNKLAADYQQVWPSDTYLNAMRSNFIYGEVKDVKYISKNGTKFGKDSKGRTVFEPIDAFKGDIARIYFYAVVSYSSLNKTNGYGASVFTDQFPFFQKDYLEMMTRWAAMDPVDKFDVIRNQRTYDVTNTTRNPFIDYPELAKIFTNAEGIKFENKGTAIDVK
ncbi:endonuclease [Mycoplasma sp. 4044]